MKKCTKSFGEVYRQAARDVAKGKEVYSCNAVSKLSSPAQRLYVKTMSVAGRGFNTFCIHEAVELHPVIEWRSARCRNFRVLLLCMMAACWRDMR